MTRQFLVRLGLSAILSVGLVFAAWLQAWAQDSGSGKSGAGQSAAERRPDRPAARTGWSSGTWSSAGSRTRACSTRSGPCPGTASSRPSRSRLAYDDESIPIGEGQTITPPYDVAFMTEVLDPKPTDRVYEVGTGSGYQSAILSRLVKEVYSVEIHAPLGKRRRQGPQGAGLHEHPYPHRRRL